MKYAKLISRLQDEILQTLEEYQNSPERIDEFNDKLRSLRLTITNIQKYG